MTSSYLWHLYDHGLIKLLSQKEETDTEKHPRIKDDSVCEGFAHVCCLHAWYHGDQRRVYMPWSWSYRWFKGCVYAENWSQVFSKCSWLTNHLSSFNNPELDIRRASRKTTKKKSWLNASKWRRVLTKCSENRARSYPAVSSECTIDQTKGKHGPQKILRKQHGWLGTRGHASTWPWCHQWKCIIHGAPYWMLRLLTEYSPTSESTRDHSSQARYKWSWSKIQTAPTRSRPTWKWWRERLQSPNTTVLRLFLYIAVC